MKNCPKCGETKPVTEFHKNSSAHDGLQTSCKVCVKAHNAALTANRKAARKTYQTASREELRAIYRAANVSVGRLLNPEASCRYAHNRRAREIGVGGRLSRDVVEKLFKSQRGKCACCTQPMGDNFHRDHIMPLALGGPNTDDNIQLLCQTCNLQKGAKHPVAFMQQRGFLL